MCQQENKLSKAEPDLRYACKLLMSYGPLKTRSATGRLPPCEQKRKLGELRRRTAEELWSFSAPQGRAAGSSEVASHLQAESTEAIKASFQ